MLQKKNVISAWGRILLGKSPCLAIEITNKCPLSCPGCYAFSPDHVSGNSLESIQDFTGDELVDGVLDVLDRRRPLLLFLVGGEPLVRLRELKRLVPEISRRGIPAEIVTSAVIPIPREWKDLKGIRVSVSVDGLQPDHDLRRKPATYERILENIKGCRVLIHCTVTAQMAARPDSLQEFVEFWGALEEVSSIRFSLYTPQEGESSPEILSPELRLRAVNELERLGGIYPKVRQNRLIIEAYLNPPRNPSECIFAGITECLSSDLVTRVTPCQLGGRPDCSQCGCAAAVGCQAIGRYRLPGGLALGRIFNFSRRIGSIIGKKRR